MEKSPSTWGCSRFGGGSAALLAVSALVAIIFSFAVATFIITRKTDSFELWWIPLVSVPMLPVAFAITWILLVDRDTVKGAVRNPEMTIENQWYSKAAETTFYFLIAGLGLSSGLFAVFDWQVSTGLVLSIAAMLGFIIFGISYIFYKHR